MLKNTIKNRIARIIEEYEDNNDEFFLAEVILCETEQVYNDLLENHTWEDRNWRLKDAINKWIKSKEFIKWTWQFNQPILPTSYYKQNI